MSGDYSWLSHFDLGLNWAVIIKWLPRLAQGATLTLELVAIAVIAGLLLAIPLGIARSSRLWYVRTLPYCYIFFFRGTPLLVQLFLLFFGLPQFGILLPAFMCGVLGLGIYSGAYVSEIVRGSIQSIDRGQMEAARSLGMPYRMAMRKVVLPQAFVRMIPPLGNEFIALIKNSALVSLLTIDDVMHEGEKIISVSYRSLETYLVIAGIYLVLTSLTTVALRRTERRLRADGRV